MSHVGCDTSPITQAQQGGGGLERNSDVSGRHAAQAAASSAGRGRSPVCPVITPLAWRSRYKLSGDMEINRIQPPSLGSVKVDFILAQEAVQPSLGSGCATAKVHRL